jgi:hypothetical protein
MKRYHWYTDASALSATRFLSGFAMKRWLTTRIAVFPKFHPFWIILLIFGSRIVSAFAYSASQSDDDAIFFTFTCHKYLQFWLDVWLAAR